MLEQLTRKEKLCVTIDSLSGSNIVPIFNYIPYTKAGYTIVDEYLEINDLKAVGWIYSLAAITFPVFELEDTESKKLLAAINLEWKSARIQLDILCKTDNLSTWQKLQAFSLLNADPYPYREYLLGNHTLGDNGMIAAQITDVGYGLLNGQDKVTIFGELTRQITINQPPIIINVTGSTTPVTDPIPDPDPTPTGDEEMTIEVIYADYQLKNKDRILAKIDVTSLVTFTLNLPINPVEGYEVEVICSQGHGDTRVNVFAANNVQIFGQIYQAVGTVFVNGIHRGGKLLYTDAEGWIVYPYSGAQFFIDDSQIP
ncbi:MAG: hypothetical protein V7K27_19990 [Nostoc sp.]|uniref:hypothetical protein n=1 Tax=Nostoc sp. TaxID=1180 RepID=UPI002FFCD199